MKRLKTRKINMKMLLKCNKFLLASFVCLFVGCQTLHSSTFSNLNVGSGTNASVIQVAQEMELSDKKVANSMGENVKYQIQMFEDYVKSYGSANEKMKAQYQFGKKSEPYIECFQNVNLLKSKKAQEETENLLSEDFDEHYDNKSTRDFHNELLNEDGSIETVGLSENIMTTEEAAKAKRANLFMLEPFPVSKLPEDLNDTKSGVDYNHLRQQKKTRLAMSASTLNYANARRLPLLDAEDLKYADPNVDISDNENVKDNKTSTQALEDVFVDARFANPEWYNGNNGLHGMTSTGVYRELLLMQAAKYNQKLHKLKMLDQIAFMLAQQSLDKNNKDMRSVLNQLRDKATSSHVD